MTATPTEYVQAHLSIITAYSKSRRFRPWFVDPDEYLQSLVVQVLAKHEQFRNDGGSRCPHCAGTGCSTWLGWQAKAVRRDLGRQYDRTKAREATEAPIEAAASVPTAWGGHQAMQRSAQVAQVLRLSGLAQRDACQTVLDDCDGTQVETQLGISMHGRNYRLRRLAQALND